MNKEDFEEVNEEVDAHMNSSEVFYKKPKKEDGKSAHQWKSKLHLEADPLMENRRVEIPDVQLVADGYVSSHKEYKIKFYCVNSEGVRSDEREILRRYSDFEWLLSQLIQRYPGCVIPPLPAKNPLTNINQEDASFLEKRKRGLLRFLEKMLKHPDLRYAPDFKFFLCSNDLEFSSQVEKSKKSGSLIPTITNLIDYVPTASKSFFSNIYSRFVEGEQIKKEKSETDHKIDQHESYISFLENSLTELANYANQMGNIEKEQSNVLLDLGNNLGEISKFDKNNKLEICHKMGENIELCSNVQKENSRYFTDDLETKLKEASAYVSSAKDTIKRRNELKDIIDKNELQIRDVEKRQSSKFMDLLKINDENKIKLDEIDNILVEELNDFEIEIIGEIDEIAREFMQHQAHHAKKMFTSWVGSNEPKSE